VIDLRKNKKITMFLCSEIIIIKNQDILHDFEKNRISCESNRYNDFIGILQQYIKGY